MSLTTTIIIAIYLAAIPVVFWVWMLLRRRSKDFESPRIWVKLFFGGVLATIPAAFIEFVYTDGFLSEQGKLCLEGLCDINVPGSMLVLFLSLLLVVAPAEELLKYLFLKQTIWLHPRFRSVTDGIRFGVVTALGFAAFENFLYFLAIIREGDAGQLAATFLIRLFLSTLAHTVYTGIVGYYIGKARFSNFGRKRTIAKGLIIAIVIHTLFNFFLFTGLGIYALIIIAIAFVALLMASRDPKNRAPAVATPSQSRGEPHPPSENIDALLKSQRTRKEGEATERIKSYEKSHLRKLRK